MTTRMLSEASDEARERGSRLACGGVGSKGKLRAASKRTTGCCWAGPLLPALHGAGAGGVHQEGPGWGSAGGGCHWWRCCS